jgi:hypothetical protein
MLKASIEPFTILKMFLLTETPVWAPSGSGKNCTVSFTVFSGLSAFARRVRSGFES